MRLAHLLPILLTAACAAKSGPAVSVTVVARGDAEAVAAIKSGLARPVSPMVEARPADPPLEPEPAPAFADVDARLAAARAKYLSADFAACLREISGEALLRDLLFEGRRSPATRVLLWRIACHHGAGSEADALGGARLFASYGLEVPSEVGLISPQAEQILARAIGESTRAKRVTLAVTTNVSPASLSVDGSAGRCALPCSIDVAPGDHVFRVDADGATPAMREVRATGAAQISIPTTPATPALAARQWLSRYAAQGDVDSAPSLRLLSTAMRAPRLALLQADRDGEKVRLRGVLASGSEIVSRGERRVDDVGAETSALLRDLLVRGKVIETAPLVKRPAFWGALAAGILLTGAASVALLYEPPTRTRVEF